MADRKLKYAQSSSGSSFRTRAAPTTSPAGSVTWTVPLRTSTEAAASPSLLATRRLNSSGSTGSDDLRDLGGVPTPPLRYVLVLDLVLEANDSVEQPLGAGRASRDVDVHRDDLVDSLRDAVGVPVRPAAVGARTHRYHVLRLGHLLVDPLDRRRHLVGDRARDDHQVRLPGRRREGDHPQAHDVVLGHGRGDELDGA